MTILLCLFTEQEKNSELPATQTEINRTFICITVSRFIKKTAYVDCGISDFKNIPKEYEQIFNDLCRLAYKALRHDKIVFSKSEIQNYCKHLACMENGCHGLGLLKAVEFYSTKENVKNMSFNFLHLSLQETLAAYHIYLSGINKQTRLLESNFMDSRYFNTWIMYVGFTKGQPFPFAFKHFLSGNFFKVSTLVTSLFKKDAKISEKFITDKVNCLHLFQCFSEAQNDDMCQYVGQLLKDGEIDLSGQTLNAVNIHTLGLFLDRSSIKHWKLLNLSNCHLGTLEVQQLLKFGSKNVSIDCLDLSYNNLTQSFAGVLAELILTWKVKKLLMHHDHDIYKNETVVNSTIRQFSNLKLMPLQSEIFTTKQSFLVFCKYGFKEIIKSDMSMDYTSVHLFSCQLGNKFHEISQVIHFLAKITKENIQLCGCKASIFHTLESVMISEISSVHIMEDSSIPSREIRCAVERLAEIALILGRDSLPLYVFNMSNTSFAEVKIPENIHGTFVFKNCANQDTYDILAYFITRKNLTFLFIRRCVAFEKAIPLLREYPLGLLQSLNLYHCKLRMEDVVLTCEALLFTSLLCINLSGNYVSNNAAEILANGIINSIFLQRLELADCNLREEGLAFIGNAIKDKNLQTLNLNGNCITDQVANNLAYIITSKCCMEYLHLSRCSL